jgi:signal transduction histidine kinase
VYQLFFYKIRHVLLYIFFLAFEANVSAQPSEKIDSLKSLLGVQSGIQRSELLIEIATELIDVNNSEALIYVNQAQDLASEFGDSLQIVKSNRIKGSILRRLEDFNAAILVLRKVLPIAKRNGFLDEEKKILNLLAIAYTFRAEYDEALRFHFESLIIREKQGRKQEISVTLNNIGLVYFKLENFEKALDYYNRSLVLKREVGDKHDLDRLLINIGLCYNQLGKYESARAAIGEGLSMCGEKCSDAITIEGKFGLGISYFIEAKRHQKGELLFESEKYFLESYAVAKTIAEKRWQVENLIYLSFIYSEIQNVHKAREILYEAEIIAQKTEYNLLIIEIYKSFSKLYNEEKDYEKAAFYQNKYIHLKDSIYSESLIKNLSKIQTDFEQRENIATIAAKEEVIKQQRDLNIAIAIIAMLAGLLVLVLQRSNRTIKRVNAQLSEAKEVIEEQNKLLEDKNKYLDKEVESKTVDLERVNQSLKQVNDELDNFIYKTSHDIRGPLASLKGMCNVALMDVKDPVALDYLSKLDTTAERLNTILTRLLIINQINNSKLSVARIDFDTIINDVLLLEKKKGLPQKLAIRRYVENEATILSDKELIRIVLENLIDNAIKFYNESDRVDSFVDIHVNTNGQGQVRVRVIDNGIGISEANPGKLFRMFFRASERSETGGIGLYIVKTATAKLGGKVGLLTTPEGYTEFYVLFPTTPPKQDDEAEKPSI